MTSPLPPVRRPSLGPTMPAASRESFVLVLQDVLARAGELAVQTAVAVLVAMVVLGVGLALRPLVRRVLARGGRPSRTRVFTALWTTVVVVVAVLLPATLAFPSVRVADVLASLGIVSVAVGFAFKDVLENLLAGVLLLLRDPFRTGDQIQVAGYEGTVEGVTVRETLLRTYDGQQVLIPNAQVYINPREVRTHYPHARNPTTRTPATRSGCGWTRTPTPRWRWRWRRCWRPGRGADGGRAGPAGGRAGGRERRA